MTAPLAFDELDPPRRDDGEPALVVDVDGYEGPLDLLLDLARRQKVDLHRISILALAEQYLAFVEEARRLRLELAADYLVMAAWLAYLKSRLLLPEPPRGEEPSAVWSLAEARAALEGLLGHSAGWLALDEYLLAYVVEPSMRPTVVASALSAALEMVREGKLSLRQSEPFGSLWVRNAAPEAVEG